MYYDFHDYCQYHRKGKQSVINFIKNLFSKAVKQPVKLSEFPAMGKLKGVDLNVAIAILKSARDDIIGGRYQFVCLAIKDNISECFHDTRTLARWVQASLEGEITAESWLESTGRAKFSNVYDTDRTFMREYRAHWIGHMIETLKKQQN